MSYLSNRPRKKGVMEKCTFCVQRINDVKIRAGNDQRPIRDGEIAPACAELFRAEAVILDYLQSEHVTIKGLTEACGECDRMIEKLTEQITSRQPRGGKQKKS